MDIEKSISSLKITNVSKTILLDKIKITYSILLNEFNIEYCKELKTKIMENEDEECFDEFIKLFLQFKENNDFALLVFECKSKYFINFYKYLDKLKNVKIFEENLYLWDNFIDDFFDKT